MLYLYITKYITCCNIAKSHNCDLNSYLCMNKIFLNMSRKKLSQTQIAFIIILWIVLVVYIFLYAELTPITIISVIMSGAIVLIPVYKSLKK